MDKKAFLALLSNEESKKVNDYLNEVGGMAPEDRVVVARRKEVKAGRLILVGDEAKNNFRHGTIVQCGPLSELQITFKGKLVVGNQIFYGDYAGKILELPNSPEGIEITVLSLHEICYITTNINN